MITASRSKWNLITCSSRPRESTTSNGDENREQTGRPVPALQSRRRRCEWSDTRLRDRGGPSELAHAHARRTTIPCPPTELASGTRGTGPKGLGGRHGPDARGQTPPTGAETHSLVTPSTRPLLTGAEWSGGAGLWGERHHAPLELDPRGRLHPAVPAAPGGQATPNSPTRRILSLAQLPGDERPHPAFLCTVTVFTEGGC